MQVTRAEGAGVLVEPAVGMVPKLFPVLLGSSGIFPAPVLKDKASLSAAGLLPRKNWPPPASATRPNGNAASSPIAMVSTVIPMSSSCPAIPSGSPLQFSIPSETRIILRSPESSARSPAARERANASGVFFPTGFRWLTVLVIESWVFLPNGITSSVSPHACSIAPLPLWAKTLRPSVVDFGILANVSVNTWRAASIRVVSPNS